MGDGDRERARASACCKCWIELMHFVAQSHKYFGFLPSFPFFHSRALWACCKFATSSKLRWPALTLATATNCCILVIKDLSIFKDCIPKTWSNSTSLFCANLCVYSTQTWTIPLYLTFSLSLSHKTLKKHTENSFDNFHTLRLKRKKRKPKQAIRAIRKV